MEGENGHKAEKKPLVAVTRRGIKHAREMGAVRTA